MTKHRTPPAPDAATPQLPAEQPSETPHIDANGFDPALYDWIPVRRKPRADGWNEDRQRRFIEVLADGASIRDAARHVGMSVQSAYRLRRLPGGEGFARAWDAAVAQMVHRLVDVAFDRALHGTDVPVFDKAGRCVGVRTRYHDRLLIFLLSAHFPDRYAAGTRRARAAERLPAPPVAEALARLGPVEPTDAAHGLAPAELDERLECADILEGQMPAWRYSPEERERMAAERMREEAERPATQETPEALLDAFIGGNALIGDKA